MKTLLSGRLAVRRLVPAALVLWLPAAAVLVVMTGLVYGSGQQILRQGANDPQIQIAEDAAARLGGGTDPHQLVPAGTVDLARSLAPYLTVFDGAGRVVASNAVLDGRTPTPPPGVLRAARHHRSEVTWQPREGVRSAAVVVAYHGLGDGTVLAGRSLAEVEHRETFLFRAGAAALIFGLAATATAAMVAAWIRTRQASQA
jgi:hypothetical protein